MLRNCGIKLPIRLIPVFVANGLATSHYFSQMILAAQKNKESTGAAK